MTAITMRQKLHQYVDGSDEKLLKLMYALAKEYNEDEDIEYDFTAEDIAGFDQRRESRLRGDSKTYGIEQAREMITGSDKPQKQ